MATVRVQTLSGQSVIYDASVISKISMDEDGILRIYGKKGSLLAAFQNWEYWTTIQ